MFRPRHVNQLRGIFHDPISANIHWREVESLLTHLGASIEAAHGARFHVKLNRAETFLHHPHHGNVCDRNLIKQLREFLAHAGVSVSSYESQHAQHSGS